MLLFHNVIIHSIRYERECNVCFSSLFGMVKTFSETMIEDMMGIKCENIIPIVSNSSNSFQKELNIDITDCKGEVTTNTVY